MVGHFCMPIDNRASVEEKIPKPYQRVYQHMTAISVYFCGRKAEQISGYFFEIIGFYGYKEMC